MKRKLVAMCMGMMLSLTLLTACGGSEPASNNAESNENIVNDQTEGEIEEELTETEAVEVTEETIDEEVQAEETNSNYEYKVVYADGVEVGINAPNGYAIHTCADGNYYTFINVRNDFISISPLTVENTSEDAMNAYNEYLTSGTWNGFWGYMEETFVEEVNVEVPGGTAMIIKATALESYNYEHAFVTIGDRQLYVSRSIEMALAANELTIEELVQQMFAEKEVTEPLYIVGNVDVEFTDGMYENYVNTFGNSSEIVLGFNFPFDGFTRKDEPWDWDGNIFNTSYNFINEDNDEVYIAPIGSGVGTLYSEVAAYRQFMQDGQYNKEAYMMSTVTYEKGNLAEMKMGESIETGMGTINVVYSLWQYPSSSYIREVALFSVNGQECIVTYERTMNSTVASLESYEGGLESMLPTMFN